GSSRTSSSFARTRNCSRSGSRRARRCATRSASIPGTRSRRGKAQGCCSCSAPGDWYAVWVFRREDEFAGWYVNFQEPFRRWDGGFDTQDLELDIWIPRDGPWEWKDREALEERVREGRFTADQAAHVRAEADAVA